MSLPVIVSIGLLLLGLPRGKSTNISLYDGSLKGQQGRTYTLIDTLVGNKNNSLDRHFAIVTMSKHQDSMTEEDKKKMAGLYNIRFL